MKTRIQVKVSIPRGGEFVVSVPLDAWHFDPDDFNDTGLAREIGECASASAGPLVRITPLKGEVARVLKVLREKKGK